MKKTSTLLFLLLTAAVAIPQNSNTQTFNKTSRNAKKPGLNSKLTVRTRVGSIKGQDIVTLPAKPISSGVPSALKRAKSKPAPLSINVTDTVIGTTYYQLQTNSSVRNGLFKSPNGKMSAVWIFSNDNGGDQVFADRGTGYAYNNGTSGWTVNNPTVRVEAQRTGWPSIAITKGNNTESFVAHNTVVDELDYVARPTQGSGTWVENTTLLKSPAVGGNWWPRMVPGNTDTNTLHVLSVTAPSGSFGGASYQHQDPALCYSRSTDGGISWDILHQVNPLIDSLSGFSGFAGDSYAIDAQGTTVAYVAGSQTSNLVLIKSTDNGTTWTKTTILTFPVQNFKGQAILQDGLTDTVNTSDGSYAILLDKNNKAHVWYGNMFIVNATNNDSGSYDYFPGTSGLMYWDESMATDSVRMIANWVDYAGTGSLNLPTGNPPYGTYDVSLTSHPSAGIDSSGYIYLAYDNILQSTDDGTGKALRNIYVTGSRDAGQTWMQAFRPDSDDGFEQVYPSVARYVNSCMSLIFQEDYAAGHGIGVGNPDAAANSEVLADIVYNCVSTGSIMAGIKENTVPVISVSNYPNPFSSVTNITVNLQKPEKVKLYVYNTIGQSVLPTQNMSLSSGSQSFSLDASGLKPGLYFYTISTPDGAVSRKMIVQ